MAYTILHDSEQDRAVLFCTTSETALQHQAFIGSDCREQAEDFLYWLGCDPRDTAGIAARGYVSLSHAVVGWWGIAFDDDGEFRPLAERGA